MNMESGKMIHSTVKTKQKLIRSSTQRKIDKLRKIIPGCEEVDVETLFQKTMEEILELKMQVDILKRLSKLHGVWLELFSSTPQPMQTSTLTPCNARQISIFLMLSLLFCREKKHPVICVVLHNCFQLWCISCKLPLVWCKCTFV